MFSRPIHQPGGRPAVVGIFSGLGLVIEEYKITGVLDFKGFVFAVEFINLACAAWLLRRSLPVKLWFIFSMQSKALFLFMQIIFAKNVKE